MVNSAIGHCYNRFSETLLFFLGGMILFNGAKATLLDNGTDLNNLTIPGFYATSNAANSQTIVNGPPTSVQFLMWVFGGKTTGYLWQIIMHKSSVYNRYKGGSDNNWGSWKKLTNEEATIT